MLALLSGGDLWLDWLRRRPLKTLDIELEDPIALSIELGLNAHKAGPLHLAHKTGEASQKQRRAAAIAGADGPHRPGRRLIEAHLHSASTDTAWHLASRDVEDDVPAVARMFSHGKPPSLRPLVWPAELDDVARKDGSDLGRLRIHGAGVYIVAPDASIQLPRAQRVTVGFARLLGRLTRLLSRGRSRVRELGLLPGIVGDPHERSAGYTAAGDDDAKHDQRSLHTYKVTWFREVAT